VKGSSLGKERQ